ncbi:MAG: hypothetical protein RSD36_18200 [Terrisporobacter sp.]
MARGIKENLIGNKIGMLNILDSKFSNRKTYYLCKCECGNEKWIRSDSIKSGKQQSCGCLRKTTQFEKRDLIGRKFGRLTVVKELEQKKGRYTWECNCLCGNTHIVEGSLLTSGKTTSCGCVKHEYVMKHQKLALKAHIDKNIIDNVNISIITRDKLMSHNTSGVTGVVWDKSRQKWKAEIIFKNKKYFLGRYENREDAIGARKEAEEKLHKDFLREKGLIE